MDVPVCRSKRKTGGCRIQFNKLLRKPQRVVKMENQKLAGSDLVEGACDYLAHFLSSKVFES